MSIYNLPRQIRIAIVLGIFLYLFQVACAFAAAPDPGASGPVIQGFERFIARVGRLSDGAIADAEFKWFVQALFILFVTLTIVWTMFRFSLRGLGVEEVITQVILILMVNVLMTTFSTWVNACWGVAEGVAGALQNGMIGTKDAFFAPQYIGNILKSISMGEFSKMIFNPLKAFVVGLNIIILTVAMVLLSALSYISVMWGFWGFTLAKLIGLMFVPFLLYERLSFLFDGWLRFFFGFIIYYIIARLNVVLVGCSLALYFGLPIPMSIGPLPPIQMPAMTSMFETIGVLTFMLVGLLSLFSTGKFAATIVSGAGGGGMGSAVQGAARMAAKIML
ncbi:type IV secretion system protein [Janthinobacterium sp. MDT1-19]|uniref:type IV secretion system protein n=1 Tax=Janthinobacterium sp. MDT1-19 TaxID=1259339 RepID=UPI003F249B24